MCTFYKTNAHFYVIMTNTRKRCTAIGGAPLVLGKEFNSQKGTCLMVKQVKISSFSEVKNIMTAATKCLDDIGVHDTKGSIADAKSILGLMSLDYTKPVMLVSENPNELEHVYNALS